MEQPQLRPMGRPSISVDLERDARFGAAGSTIVAHFHGAELIGVENQGKAYVALKPIVEALGLDWAGQLQRIRRSEILSEGVVITPMAGHKNGMACLELELLSGWLFGMDVSRIADADRRAKILLYQRECYRVLASAFGRTDANAPASTSAAASKPLAALPAPERTAMPPQLARSLVVEARHIFGPAAARALWFKLGLPIVAEMAVGTIGAEQGSDTAPDLFATPPGEPATVH